MKVPSSASLPDKRNPVIKVKKICSKETKGNMEVRETRRT